MEAGWKLEFGHTALCFTLIDYLNRQEFSRQHNSKVTRNLSPILTSLVPLTPITLAPSGAKVLLLTEA
jgi:hypothetical protein